MKFLQNNCKTMSRFLPENIALNILETRVYKCLGWGEVFRHGKSKSSVAVYRRKMGGGGRFGTICSPP